MTKASEVLPERFLIDLVWVDRISMVMQTPNGHSHPLERTLTLRVMAIEKNETPGLPLREATYDLQFIDVSGFRLDLPLSMDETSFDMDVDDVTLQERTTGISTVQFQNASTGILIDFKEVTRTLIHVKECER